MSTPTHAALVAKAGVVLGVTKGSVSVEDDGDCLKVDGERIQRFMWAEAVREALRDYARYDRKTRLMPDPV